MQKQTGIWLNYNHADIIHLLSDEVEIVKVESNIDHQRIGGGSRSKTPYGPMDNTSESKLLERKKHQINNYFKKITEEISDSSEVFLFGPSDSKVKYRKYLAAHSGKKPNVFDVITADSMTENQKVAKVKDIFKIHNKKKRIVFP